VADRLGERYKAVYALVPAIAFLTRAPFYLARVPSTTLWMTLELMLVPTALGLAWLGPVLTAVQHVVPLNMRAMSSAIFLFINNLLGIGLGTPLMGTVECHACALWGRIAALRHCRRLRLLSHCGSIPRVRLAAPESGLGKISLGLCSAAY